MNVFRSQRLPYLLSLMLGLLGSTVSVSAISETALEEIIVTAQRSEESLQDVPIAVTALTGDMLQDKGVINPSDLQMQAPNVSFSSTNFGGSSFSIRGIGQLVISSSADAGVSIHQNEIPYGTNLNANEFFDVARVEVLRGPQGTLFGRNATGGVVNIVTQMPEYGSFGGFLDLEAGDYNHSRLKGALNIPMGDNMGLRIAAMKLDRDGYIENKAAVSRSTIDGSALPFIDDDIDGRDIQAYRVTWSWEPTENSSLWVMYNYSEEEDDRARLTNQVCQRTSLPTLGCEPDGFGFDSPNLGSTTGGLFFMLNGFNTLPLGAAGINGQQGIVYDHVAPALGLRSVFTDTEPVFYNEEKNFSFGFDYEFENISVGILGSYGEGVYNASMDYNMNVGPILGPNPVPGFGGLWPTSAPSQRAGGYVTGENGCSFAAGNAGIFGGCTYPADGNRLYAIDQNNTNSEGWNIEIKMSSNFDGPVNFLVGASTYHSKSFGEYFVNANSLDTIGLVGVGLLGFPPLYPTMFSQPGNPSDPGAREGTAVFGELYFEVNEKLKITAGLRYNKDEKTANDANTFLSSLDQNFLVPVVTGLVGGDPNVAIALGLLDPDYQAALASLPAGRWGRGSDIMLGGLITPGFFAPEQLARFEFFGISADQVAAAAITPSFSPERAALLNAIGPITGFNEIRALTGSPTEAEWTSTTGRIGFDYQWNENTMIYGFYTKGYKPGGFNPPIAPEFQDDTAFIFDEEEVGSIEFGFKSTLLDGQLQLNGAAFAYDYEGLQVTRIRNNSSINENIDSDIRGLEVEFVWRPSAMENLGIDGAFSWLDTELADGVSSVDVINKSAGDPDWINLKNIDPGALTGTNYVAFAPAITPAVLAAAYANNGALSDVNGTAVPGTVSDAGIPSYFSRNFLTAAGVPVSSGLLSDISGNSLPNSPETTVRLGVQYTWPIDGLSGELTMRWDYYWQDDSYGREFNTVGDEIDSWDQHNLSLIYQSNDGNWQARLWARNLQDEDNVTGHYLTSDTSGYFRNYFLTEPRIYGLSLKYRFGE